MVRRGEYNEPSKAFSNKERKRPSEPLLLLFFARALFSKEIRNYSL